MHILENEALTLAVADRGAELSRVWDREAGCERLWGADPAIWNRHAPIIRDEDPARLCPGSGLYLHGGDGCFRVPCSLLHRADQGNLPL